MVSICCFLEKKILIQFLHIKLPTTRLLQHSLQLRHHTGWGVLAEKCGFRPWLGTVHSSIRYFLSSGCVLGALGWAVGAAVNKPTRPLPSQSSSQGAHSGVNSSAVSLQLEKVVFSRRALPGSWPGPPEVLQRGPDE